MLTDDRRVVLLTLLAQIGVSVGLAGGLGLWYGNVVAVSVLLGGMAAVIPNAFLAARLLRPRVHDSAGAILRSAWIGVAGKLLLTALMFGVIFGYLRPIAAPAVFAGFIAAQLVIFAALLGPSRAVDMEATTKS